MSSFTTTTTTRLWNRFGGGRPPSDPMVEDSDEQVEAVSDFFGNKRSQSSSASNGESSRSRDNSHDSSSSLFHTSSSSTPATSTSSTPSLVQRDDFNLFDKSWARMAREKAQLSSSPATFDATATRTPRLSSTSQSRTTSTSTASPSKSYLKETIHGRRRVPAENEEEDDDDEADRRDDEDRVRSERRSRRRNEGTDDYLSIQKRYNIELTSPILPKVKLAFPTILSDEEEENPWHPSTPRSIHSVIASTPPKHRNEHSSPSASVKSPSKFSKDSTRRQRSTSTTSTTTTTTTTTRRERRTWTYSMPSPVGGRSLVLDIDDNASNDATPSEHRRKSRTSSPAAPPSSPISGSHAWRTPQSASTSRTKSFGGPSSPTTASPLHPQFFRARSPSTPSIASTRKSSLSNSRKASPSTRSSTTRRTSSHRSSAPGPSSLRNGGALAATRNSTSNVFSKYDPRALSIAPQQFAGPVIGAFAFLVVSTMACFAIGSLLLSSIALTFYDDCGKTLTDVQRGLSGSTRRIRDSLEGARSGMQKMIGGARDALDLVVSAAGSARAIPTIILDNVDLDIDGSDAEELYDSSGMSSKADTEVFVKTRGRDPPPVDKSREATSPSSRGKTPDEPTTRHHVRHASCTSDDSNNWTENEEDNLPYTVPPPTRPASPTRESSSSKRDDSNKLPPRPALSLLLPSIGIALLYTIWTVLANFWKSSKKR